jgi:2-polyprenyl-3-methyl-5-hydroxy-6-metoxy-1,4-benzoquinol methylase
MGPVAYATLRGMERFVDMHAVGVQLVEGPVVPARFELGTLAGWRKRQAGCAQVVRVSGAWVHDSSGFFASAREEMLPLVPADARHVVDVGGGEGGFLSALKARYPAVHTQLVELTEGAAAKARGRPGVDAVWVGDFQAWSPGQRFDCISFLDVIEHMVDPERALRHARSLLRDTGCVVLSIPNAGHWSVVADLLEGRWDWAPSGIHCYTHLRFFTRRTIEDMLARADLMAVEWLPVVVPGRADWLAQWQGSAGLAVDVAALDVYAYGVRAVATDK